MDSTKTFPKLEKLYSLYNILFGFSLALIFSSMVIFRIDMGIKFSDLQIYAINSLLFCFLIFLLVIIKDMSKTMEKIFLFGVIGTYIFITTIYVGKFDPISIIGILIPGFYYIQEKYRFIEEKAEDAKKTLDSAVLIVGISWAFMMATWFALDYFYPGFEFNYPNPPLSNADDVTFKLAPFFYFAFGLINLVELIKRNKSRTEN